MEMISSFIWFLAGATTALAFRFLIHYKEDLKATDNIVAHLFYLIRGYTTEISAAILLKHEAMKASNLPDDVTKKIINEDLQNFVIWKERIIEFLLTSLPKRYYTYLRYRFESTEEMILYFIKLSQEIEEKGK